MDSSIPIPSLHPQRIERRRTISESTGTASPWFRKKVVTMACERCRRRKIRCDGETPCATCRRFQIPCVRLPKGSEAQAALEQRVRQLERQMAQLNPNQRLDTSVEPDRLSLYIPPAQSFGTMPDMDVPQIDISDFAGSFASHSPTPSELSIRPSPNSISDHNISPHSLSYTPPGYETNPHLSPNSAERTSRRSSTSSSTGNYNISPSFGVPHYPDQTSPIVRHSAENPFTVNPVGPSTHPILETFFNKASEYGYLVDRGRFQSFLGIVNGQQPAGTYSISMARFHVYMAMAIGLRISTDERMNSYYQAAMDQAKSPQFWEQRGCIEAATLLVLFAQISEPDS